MTELQKSLNAVNAHERQFDTELETEFGGLWVADKYYSAGEILKALNPKAYRIGLSQFFTARLAELLEESETNK